MREDGARGQQGVADTADRHAQVRGGPGARRCSGSPSCMVACVRDHAMAVMEEGAVWSHRERARRGRGHRGRLGHNEDRDRLAPARVGYERF